MKNNAFGMPPPSSRKEFEHNVYLVLEKTKRVFDSGNEKLIKIKLLVTVPHLKRLSNLPNKRIDLYTINEMLRTQANMMDWMKHMPHQSIEKESNK